MAVNSPVLTDSFFSESEIESLIFDVDEAKLKSLCIKHKKGASHDSTKHGMRQPLFSQLYLAYFLRVCTVATSPLSQS